MKGCISSCHLTSRFQYGENDLRFIRRNACEGQSKRARTEVVLRQLQDCGVALTLVKGRGKEGRKVGRTVLECSAVPGCSARLTGNL